MRAFAPARSLRDQVVGDRDAAALPVVAAAAPRALVPRDDRAFAVDRGPELHQRRGPVAGARVLFEAVEHELDRRVRSVREQRDGAAFGARGELAAEAAADELGVDRHRTALQLRRAHRLRELAAHAERRLRAHPDLEVRPGPLRDGAVRLHRRMRLHFGAVGAGDGRLRLGEGVREILWCVGPRVRHVALFVEHRRAVGEQEVDGVRVLLVLRDDRLDRVAAHVERGGRDRRDLVADEADLLAGLLQLDHRGDAGHRARLLEVERDELAARDGGAKDRGLQHPGERHVVRVLRAARGLVATVDAVRLGTDDRELRRRVPRRRVAVRNVERARLDERAEPDLELLLRRREVARAHRLPPCMRDAALSTASQMRP